MGFELAKTPLMTQKEHQGLDSAALRPTTRAKPTKMLPFGDGIAMLQYASGLGTDSEANAPSSADYDDDSQAGQKRRCVWTEDLHARFELAVESLGIDYAKPMAILDHMGVKGLTKANIKSHLQKYRMKMSASKGDGPTGAGLRMLSAASRKPTSISLGPQLPACVADLFAVLVTPTDSGPVVL